MDAVDVVIWIGSILAVVGGVILVSAVVFAWRHGERGGRPNEYDSAHGRWWAGWW